MEGVTPQVQIVDEVQDFDVQKEAEELGEILEEMDRVIAMPNPKENYYPVNRAARRAGEKRNRATKKRKPNG